MTYRLVVGGKNVGDPVRGTGGPIVLESAPLMEQTTFRVKASRHDDGRINTLLDAQITVTVEAAKA